MDISISIIDKKGSKVSDEANARLLWTAVLMGESVNASCEPAGLLHLILYFDEFTEKQKFSIYMHTLNANPTVTEETKNSTEQYYSKIVRARNMKGKTKEHIVLLMKGENWLKELLVDFKRYLTNVSTKDKTTSLLPLTCTDQDNWNKPLLAWTFPKENTETRIHQRIQVVSGTITDSGGFPFYDSIVKQYFTSNEMNNIKNTGYVNFISDFLMEIPEPLSLTTSQAHLVRNDFSQTSWKLFREMQKLNEELKDIPFRQNNFERIYSLYQEKITPLKAFVQKTIDENVCFNELKSEIPNGKTYRIYAGISSFTTILDFYKELGIIDVSDVLYCREDMASRADINNSRLFLFMETIDNVDEL